MNEEALISALNKLGANVPKTGFPKTDLIIPPELVTAITRMLEGLSLDEQAAWFMKMAATSQKLEAAHEEIYHPLDPSTARRNPAPMDVELRQMVNEMLDAAEDFSPTASADEAATAAEASADVHYFEQKVKAAKHVQNLTSKSDFSKVVSATRHADAELIVAKGRFPTSGEIKREVIRRLGHIAPSEGQSSRWTEIFKAASIQGRRRREGVKNRRG